jgi:DNA-directed RNA polymerase subunit RPC12/RpoP
MEFVVLRMVANDGSVMNINPLWFIDNISLTSENGHVYEVYRNPFNLVRNERTIKATIKPTEMKDIESCICCGAKRPENYRPGKIIQNATSGEMIYICAGCDDLEGILRAPSQEVKQTYNPAKCDTCDINKLIKSVERDLKHIKRNLQFYKDSTDDDAMVPAGNLFRWSKKLEKHTKYMVRESTCIRCTADGL